jgi:hypothetical protein
MRIRILPTNSYCLGTVEGGEIHINCCSLKDCNLDFSTERHLENQDLPCLTTLVNDNELFFVTISNTNKHPGSSTSWTQESSHIGYLEEKKLILTQKLKGDSYRFVDGQNFLVYAHQPTDFTSLDNHSCCLMTSDAMISLDEDTYVGYKDGHISTLTASELLDQLSKHKVEKSPSFKQVRLSAAAKRPARAVRGTLIYNEKADELEFYGRSGWQRINKEEIK